MGKVKELFQTWLEDHATPEELSAEDWQKNVAFLHWMNSAAAKEKEKENSTGKENLLRTIAKDSQ